MKRNFNIYLTISLVFILSSCSIAGSWLYERADGYLADYFKEYANFSDEQKDEIDEVTKNYLDWFTRNELPEIRAVLVNLKDINNGNADNLVNEVYLSGQELFERSNKYFEKSFIEFSKTLTDLQVEEIKNHFEEIQIKRDKSRKGEKSYLDEVVDEGDLMKRAMEVATDLATLGHPHYQMTKDLDQKDILERINAGIEVRENS